MRIADVYLNLLGALMLIFLSALIVWSMEGFVRWLRKQPAVKKLTVVWSRRVAALVSSLNLIYVMALLAALMFLGPGAFVNGTPPVVVALYSLPLLSAVLTFTLVVYTVLAWRKHFWSLLGRIHYSLVTLAALAFLWFLNYWDLFGFRF
jgi:hypothetical protein